MDRRMTHSELLKGIRDDHKILLVCKTDAFEASSLFRSVKFARKLSISEVGVKSSAHFCRGRESRKYFNSTAKFGTI